jgi:PAS domain-containing protein
VNTAAHRRGERDKDLAWAARVQRLEAEVAGLRRAMRTRAVIEQAKGLLAGTLGCTPDEAFDHLVRSSQRENRRVADLAARIMGAAAPVAAEESPTDAGHRANAPLFDPVTYLRQTLGDEPAREPATRDFPMLNTSARGSSARDTVARDSSARDTVARDNSARGATTRGAAARARLQAAVAAISSAASLSELADRLLVEGVGWMNADAVMVYRLEPDGALRLLACAGLPAELASDWRRIPSALTVPVREAIAGDEPVWTQAGDQLHQHFTRLGGGSACLPLRYAGRPFAAVVFLWRTARMYRDDERRYLTAVAANAGRRVHQLSTDAGDAAAPGHWLQATLNVIPTPLVLMSPMRDERGVVVDFVIDYANPQAGQPYGQDPSELLGARLLDVHPELADSGVFDAYRQVLASGVSWTRVAEAETILIDGEPSEVHIGRSAARLGDGLLIAWQPRDADTQLARTARIEELGRVGYAEWDLVSGRMFWSPGVYAIFRRRPARGPIPLEQLPDHVEPDDLPLLEHDVQVLLEKHEDVEMQFRLRTATGPRLLQVRARPVVDVQGELTSLYATIVDLTDLQQHFEALHRASRAAAIRRVNTHVQRQPE